MNNLPAGHYGLRGMRERVLALGGELKLTLTKALLFRLLCHQQHHKK
ncbi:hypothetical protein [Candidatus Villigracilis affinis]|nr:hypothetical protein [Anaerolineales bacterium]